MTEANLTAEAKNLKNEYARQWRAKNKDKVRESNKRYWEKQALKKALKEAETGADDE